MLPPRPEAPKRRRNFKWGLIQNSSSFSLNVPPFVAPEEKCWTLGIRIIFLALVVFRFSPQNMEQPENMEDHSPISTTVKLGDDCGPIAAVLNQSSLDSRDMKLHIFVGLLIVAFIASIMGQTEAEVNADGTVQVKVAGSITVTELMSQSNMEIFDFLSGIYEHSAWVAETLVAQADACSAITTVSALATAMKKIVDAASNDQKMALLLAHPDLCEKVGKMEKLTKESQEEQSSAGLQTLSEEELESFTSNNTAYRAKFGFPFILAVRNASKYTVLSALQGRLPNAAEKEFAVALEQVHKIAWMRLLSKLNTDDAAGFLTCHVLDTANGCPGKCRCILNYTGRLPDLAATCIEVIQRE
jgi:2-oxo-4-hydroxy-4-carboxy-5-ureidoimidazoline decarboxylase